MAAKKNTAKPDEKAQGNKTENIVKIEDAGPCKKKVSIEIPTERISKMFDEQYFELRKDALVPGFRKGRVPRRLLEKRFGKEVGEQAKVKLLLEASEAALKDNNIDSLGEPDIDPEKIEMPAAGPLKFDFEIEVRPEFELPSLENIPAEKPKLKVTDESVEGEIAEIRKRLGVWKPKDGKIEADDQIIADVVLKPEDGEQEKIENTEVYARPRAFVGKVPVEKLDKLLVGAKVGDVKTTSTEVPSSFFDEKYRNKKVGVEIKINDIKRLEPAELNESFFKRFGTTDKAGLVEMIRQRNEANIEKQQTEAMRESVREYLLSKVDFELPANIVGDQSQQLLQRQYTRLLMQGLKAEDIASQMEQLRAASEEQAKEQLKSFFIMDAIAKKLDIQTSEEEINGYIAQAAMYRQTRPEKLREQMSRDGSLTQVALEIREIKCIDKILESAKITEVSPKEAGKESKPAKKTAKKAEPAKKVEDAKAKKPVKAAKKSAPAKKKEK
ncbi:MAG: trigger factor [Phycisphaerae bacterium]|nr:trigger factor [Phycisphaerae bacterium]